MEKEVKPLRGFVGGCASCGKNFRTSADYDRHMLDKHGIKTPAAEEDLSMSTIDERLERLARSDTSYHLPRGTIQARLNRLMKSIHIFTEQTTREEAKEIVDECYDILEGPKRSFPIESFSKAVFISLAELEERLKNG